MIFFNYNSRRLFELLHQARQKLGPRVLVFVNSLAFKSFRMTAPTFWTHESADLTYVCSTDPNRLDLDALNAALGSDLLWWANSLPEDRLKTMVDNCLIFGLYLAKSASQGKYLPVESVVWTSELT